MLEQLAQLSTVQCGGGGSGILERLQELAPSCGANCQGETADSTASRILSTLPDLAVMLSTCAGSGECAASETPEAWADKVLAETPRLLQRLCQCLPPAPADGAPCDAKCEEQNTLRSYCAQPATCA